MKPSSDRLPTAEAARDHALAAANLLTPNADAAGRKDKQVRLYREALVALARSVATSMAEPAKGPVARSVASNRRKPSQGTRLHADPASAAVRPAKSTLDLAGTGVTFKITRKSGPVVTWQLDKLGRWLRELAALMRERERYALGLKSFGEHSPNIKRARRSALHVLEALAQFESDFVHETPSVRLSRDRDQAPKSAAARTRVGRAVA